MKRKRLFLGAIVAGLAIGALVVAIRGEPEGSASSLSNPKAGEAEGGLFSNSELRLGRVAEHDAGTVQAATAQGQGAAVATFGWGAGPGQLGRERPQEGNPVGPMSLANAPGGGAWVLDQVNNRLVKVDRDGKVENTQPLTLQGAQDVAVGKDGTVVVLDRLLDKQVALFSPDGKAVGSLPVEGKNIEEGGAVSGVFVDGDGVYVEREHGDLVKIGDTSGKADPDRAEVPGRPSRDGKAYLTAMITSPAEGKVAVTVIDRPSLQLRFTRELRIGAEVYGLNLLDTDQAGIIYLGVMQFIAKGPGPEDKAPGVLLLCLDPRDGATLGKVELPANESPEETVRELVVLDQGGVLYLHRTNEGATLTRWDCR